MPTSLSPGVPSGIAESPAGLLDQADHLFVCGFPIAAGMLTRAGLETYLRQLCAAHDCEPPLRELRRSVKEATIDNLELADVFDAGNQVVHCELTDAASIENLLHDVRRFVKKGGAI